MFLTKYKDVILNQVFNRLNVIVFIFALLLFAIGRYSEGFISASIVIFNIVVSVYQEIKAKMKLEKLNFTNNNQYFVKRGEVMLYLLQEELIEGDIVQLKIGNQVPSDSEVFNGFLQVDESFMTGESDLISKEIGSKIFAGSNIFSGNAEIKVLKPYNQSIIKELEKKGKIFGLKFTPIENKINQLIALILVFILWFIILTTIFLVLRKVEFDKIILINSVISGLVPSTLLAMVTVVNSWSVAKTYLKKENLLPQKLNAYESLSNVDVFCFDKTGTLTTNNIQFLKGVNNENIISQNEFKKYTSLFFNNVTSHTRSSEIIKQNYTDIKEVKIIEEKPFNSQNKFSSLTIEEAGKKIKLTLGAPEYLIDKENILYNSILNEQNKGNRIIVIMIQKGTEFEYLMGYYILKEELRREIVNVFETLEKENKMYKIISGDNPNSILAVANSIGLNITHEEIISGTEIRKMSKKELSKLLPKIKIFGRMTPEDKENVIELLKEKHYVAMLGDGVNDLLPIKKANLGIALQSGASATKLGSDLILLNDDYSSLIRCINLGNINKFILNSIYVIFFSRFIYLSVIYMTLILIFRSLPFTVIHSSLISLLSVGLGIFLMFNLVYKFELNWKTITNFEFIIPTSFLTIFLSLSLVYNMISNGIKFSNISTSLVIFLVISALGINVLSVLPVNKSRYVLSNYKKILAFIASQLLILILLIVIIYTPFLRNIWSLTPIGLSEYIRLLYFVLVWLLGLVIIYFLDSKFRSIFAYFNNRFFKRL
jgi:cation-transporting P-type ATPase E